MLSQKFELTNLSNSQTDLTAIRDNRSGCHVSALDDFVFLMLSAAVAVWWVSSSISQEATEKWSAGVILRLY
ncbi:hypothetical protein BgiBS90_037322 [Biomphalaria glabrata]|nr:hypothetical protein BgiBS90_037322 [Biomphalaria glabrata]